MSALMTSSWPKIVNYAQNRNSFSYESVLQIMKLKHMNTSKTCKRRLKVKIYSIVIHLAIYVCKLERNGSYKKGQEQLAKYERRIALDHNHLAMYLISFREHAKK